MEYPAARRTLLRLKKHLPRLLELLGTMPDSRRLSAGEHARIRLVAESWFADALGLHRRVADLCLFVQRGPGSPFVLAGRVGLAG